MEIMLSALGAIDDDWQMADRTLITKLLIMTEHSLIQRLEWAPDTTK
jgi:hypothetical protein